MKPNVQTILAFALILLSACGCALSYQQTSAADPDTTVRGTMWHCSHAAFEKYYADNPPMPVVVVGGGALGGAVAGLIAAAATPADAPPSRPKMTTADVDAQIKACMAAHGYAFTGKP